jgi:CspA family cold shock protein
MSADATGSTIEATVTWFNVDKGFGFVELADGSGDAFLHVAVVQAAGHDSVAPGTKLRVQVGQGQKGRQITSILELEAADPGASRSRHAPPRMSSDRGRVDHSSSATTLDGAVKWFNGQKGFGFVGADDGAKDVFIHISVLERAGMASLAEGQRVRMQVVSTQKGREAISIETID